MIFSTILRDPATTPGGLAACQVVSDIREEKTSGPETDSGAKDSAGQLTVTAAVSSPTLSPARMELAKRGRNPSSRSIVACLQFQKAPPNHPGNLPRLCRHVVGLIARVFPVGVWEEPK
jgi:hypothetical protein